MTQLIWALATLAAGAIGAIALWRWARWSLGAALAAIGAAGVLCVWAGLGVLLQDGSPRLEAAWTLPLGSAHLRIDALSAWFLLPIGVVSVATAAYAWGYFRNADRRVGAVGPLMCVLVAGMTLSVCAADAVLFLLGWELMSLAAFFLIGFHHRDPEARRGAWMYLVATHLGTAIGVVPVLGAFVARTQTTSFAAFAGALEHASPAVPVVLFLFGLVGFGTKAGFMPVHVWLPVAHPAAPTPVSALLSGVMIKMGIYGLLRLLSWLPALPAGCAMVMLALSMISGVLGVLYALAQHDLKRLLAYHSVENIGIIGLGVGAGMLGQSLGQPALVALGYGGALLHVLNHALFKGLLFLSAGGVVHATGTGDMERLGGLARKTPVNAALFLIGAVSICGLPPFNGFVSEWMVYGSLFGGALRPGRATAGTAALGVVSLALMGGLALACFAKVFSVVFLGEPRDAATPRDRRRPHRTPGSMRMGMSILAVLCVGIGLLPGVIVPLTNGGVGAVAHASAAEFETAVQGVLAPMGRLSALAAVLAALIAGLAVARRVLARVGPPILQIAGTGGHGQPVKTAMKACPAPPTWGCGYASPTARMQYTASSMAWSLIRSFRSLLWPYRVARLPTGVFPSTTHLETHTPDMAEHDLFAPLFRGVSRACRMVRTVSWTGEVGGERRTAGGGDRSLTVAALNGAALNGGSLNGGSLNGAGRIGPGRALLGSLVAALRRGSVHVYLAFMVATLVAVILIGSLASPGGRMPPVRDGLGGGSVGSAVPTHGGPNPPPLPDGRVSDSVRQTGRGHMVAGESK